MACLPAGQRRLRSSTTGKVRRLPSHPHPQLLGIAPVGGVKLSCSSLRPVPRWSRWVSGGQARLPRLVQRAICRTIPRRWRSGITEAMVGAAAAAFDCSPNCSTTPDNRPTQDGTNPSANRPNPALADKRDSGGKAPSRAAGDRLGSLRAETRPRTRTRAGRAATSAGWNATASWGSGWRVRYGRHQITSGPVSELLVFVLARRQAAPPARAARVAG
jgi:hypothetical protein